MTSRVSGMLGTGCGVWEKHRTGKTVLSQQHGIYMQQQFPNHDICTANHWQAAPGEELELLVLVPYVEAMEPCARAGWYLHKPRTCQHILVPQSTSAAVYASPGYAALPFEKGNLSKSHRGSRSVPLPERAHLSHETETQETCF